MSNGSCLSTQRSHAKVSLFSNISISFLTNCFIRNISYGDSDEELELRPITGEDFLHALVKMRDSRVLDRSAKALMKIDLD